MTPLSHNKQSSYTYDDYRAFPQELRCEIIDGRIYDMTPAPSLRHQETALKVARLVADHLDSRRHACRVYIAPADVILAHDTVVQPDIFIVCDPSKIRGEGLFGAPDAIFEILSPATWKRDRGRKMKLYRDSGVTEYFLVDPEHEVIEKYLFPQGQLALVDLYENDEAFTIDCIGLELTAFDIFPPKGDFQTTVQDAHP